MKSARMPRAWRAPSAILPAFVAISQGIRPRIGAAVMERRARPARCTISLSAPPLEPMYNVSSLSPGGSSRSIAWAMLRAG
jgi:hypothetical protein